MSSITGVSSMATRKILDELGRRYAAASNCEVAIRAMGGVDAAQSVRAGESVDVIVLASGAMQKLEADGFVVAGSTQGVARSGMAIAVRAGALRPDIGNEAAVEAAVRAAARVAYSTGPSGDHLLKLCERWGIDPARLIKAPPGIPVGSLVAERQAELGFQQLSELIDVDGIDVVGPLPSDIQSETVFAAGVAATSSQPAAVADLIAFFRSPEADEVIRAQGMEPARD